MKSEEKSLSTEKGGGQIGTARMNGIEPEAWLTDVIARIGAFSVNRLAELLPWNWQPQATRSVAA